MSKKIIATTIAVAIAVSSVTAEEAKNKNNKNEVGINYEGYDYILETRTKSGKLSTRVSVNALKERMPQQEDSYLDTVIFNDIKERSYIPKTSKAVSVAFTRDNIGEYLAAMEKSSKNKQKREKEKAVPKYYHAKGFCKFKNSVEVTASNEFSMLSCALNVVGEESQEAMYSDAKLFVGLYPDYKKETLVALPVYVEISGKQYPASGVLLNASMTSLNVANYVDNVRIRKLLAKSLLVTSDVAYTQATRYLKELEKSKEENRVDYVPQTLPNGNSATVPVVTKNTQKPDKRDYWAVGIVELAASLVDLFGKDYLDYMTPLFKVNAGSVAYADFMFSVGGGSEKTIIEAYKNNEKLTIETANKNNEKWNEEKMKIDAKEKVDRRGGEQ